MRAYASYSAAVALAAIALIERTPAKFGALGDFEFDSRTPSRFDFGAAEVLAELVAYLGHDVRSALTDEQGG